MLALMYMLLIILVPLVLVVIGIGMAATATETEKTEKKDEKKKKDWEGFDVERLWGTKAKDGKIQWQKQKLFGVLPYPTAVPNDDVRKDGNWGSAYAFNYTHKATRDMVQLAEKEFKHQREHPKEGSPDDPNIAFLDQPKEAGEASMHFLDMLLGWINPSKKKKKEKKEENTGEKATRVVQTPPPAAGSSAGTQQPSKKDSGIYITKNNVDFEGMNVGFTYVPLSPQQEAYRQVARKLHDAINADLGAAKYAKFAAENPVSPFAAKFAQVVYRLPKDRMSADEKYTKLLREAEQKLPDAIELYRRVGNERAVKELSAKWKFVRQELSHYSRQGPDSRQPSQVPEFTNWDNQGREGLEAHYKDLDNVQFDLDYLTKEGVLSRTTRKVADVLKRKPKIREPSVEWDNQDREGLDNVGDVNDWISWKNIFARRKKKDYENATRSEAGKGVVFTPGEDSQTESSDASDQNAAASKRYSAPRIGLRDTIGNWAARHSEDLLTKAPEGDITTDRGYTAAKQFLYGIWKDIDSQNSDTINEVYQVRNAARLEMAKIQQEDRREYSSGQTGYKPQIERLRGIAALADRIMDVYHAKTEKKGGNSE